jgi:hypothetical protein
LRGLRVYQRCAAAFGGSRRRFFDFAVVDDYDDGARRTPSVRCKLSDARQRHYAADGALSADREQRRMSLSGATATDVGPDDQSNDVDTEATNTTEFKQRHTVVDIAVVVWLVAVCNRRLPCTVDVWRLRCVLLLCVASSSCQATQASSRFCFRRH